MNILYINHYAGSLSMGMEFRPYYFAREWNKSGHNVRIIGANYSHLRKENPKVKKDFEIQNIDGVEFQWIITREYEGNGVSRAITMAEFVLKLYMYSHMIVKQFKPDVVITSSTYPLDSFAGKHIADIAKCKYVHEGHDLWPLTLTEIGGMSKWNPFVMVMAIGERYAYSHADHIVSVLPNSYEHMLKHGLKSKDMFTHIPNGVALEDWESPQSLPLEHRDLLEELCDKNKFIICYLGGHALSNKLDRFIDAATILQNNEELAFVLIGNGVEKESLVQRVNDLNLDNVYFLPPLGKLQVPSALEYANVLYIGAENSPLYKYGVSLNKVYDYMMAAKPIAYGVCGTANNEVEEAKAGITFDSDNVQEICNAIVKLKNSNSLVEMGTNGQKWVLENCEYSKLAEKFITVLRQ